MQGGSEGGSEGSAKQEQKELMSYEQGVNEGGEKGHTEDRKRIRERQRELGGVGGKTRLRWRGDVWRLGSQIKQGSSYRFALTALTNVSFRE